jgi:hypothetical protein
MRQMMNPLRAGIGLLALIVLFAWPGQVLSGQSSNDRSSMGDMMKKADNSTMTDAQKIALAVSAGPVEITRNATVMDMTDMSKPPRQLRAGTNGWVCYAIPGMPMCLDKEWQKWMQAWMNKTTPQITATGIAYMLAGDNGASNTDPFATAATPTNQWVVAPAHIMLLVPDAKLLDSYPTDPKTGGPWVMWKGTPYAHVMVPVAMDQMATMPSR